MTPGGRPLHSPPPFASPLFGPVPALVPSGRSNRANSSSSSPTTSSPSTSPSPWAESENVVNGSPPPTLHLPPQAYPGSPRTHISADPMKIPPSSSFVGSVDALREGGGETLKFTRRPGPTNHPTSPLALFPVGRQHHRTASSAYGSVSSSLGLTSLDARASSGALRTERPVGFTAQGGPRVKSDSSVVIKRTQGNDSRSISDDDGQSSTHLDRDHAVPYLSLGQTASPRQSPFRQDFPSPPPLPLSPRGHQPPQPRPSPTRRRSIPMHHCSASPTTNALASSSQHTVAPSHAPPRSSPLSPVTTSHVPPSPNLDRGRHSLSDSREDRASRSRSRVVRSGTRSRTREGEDRHRRGSSKSHVVDDEPRRGRRGSSRRSEDSSSDVGDESGGDGSRGRRDETISRGRGAIGRASDGAAAPPPRPYIGPSADYVPVFERTPEHRSRSLSQSPDSLANGGGATIRGRRPTVHERTVPSALTVLNGGGTLRTAPLSKSRSRDRKDRDVPPPSGRDAAIEDLSGRMQGVKVMAS